MGPLLLGYWAKDKVTGYRGIIISHCAHQYNCDRVMIMPRDLKEDGTTHDGMWFDLPQVDVGDQVLEVPAIKPGSVVLGDSVKDKISPFKGVVTALAYHNNGCIRAGVTPPALNRDLQPADSAWFALGQLEVVEKPKEAVTAPRTGGPMRAPVGARNPR